MKSTLQTAMLEQPLNSRVFTFPVLAGWFVRINNKIFRPRINKFLFLLVSFCCAYLFSFAQNNPCVADFTFQQDGNTVKFFSSPNPSNTPLQHYWQFGDGGNSNQSNPVHTYVAPGTYRVLHYVKDSANNCFDSVSKSIVLTFTNCTIEPKFEWRRDSLNCKKIWFINQSVPISPNVRFTWKFGDGSTSNDISPAHEYNLPGSYNVCLTIESGNDCKKEICKTVVVNCDTCALQVDFRFEKDSAQPNKVYFFSTVNYPPGTTALYSWSFGDGTGWQGVNAEHTYTQPGVYTACLKVFISNTCFKTVCKTIVIGDSCALQVKWRSEADSAHPRRIKFYNETIVPSTGALYSWSFGDGGVSQERDPVHIYEKPGAYNVCLKVVISNTCIRALCRTILVDSSSCRLEAKFEFRIDSLQKNKVHFINHTFSNQTTVHYLWKFGDGTTSNEINPTHIYQQPGSYEVCLVAETTNGCRSVYCKKVEIGNNNCQVVAKFEWRRDAQNWKKIWFTNHSQPVQNIWRTHWYYGDGTTSQDFNSFHEYANAGKYYVCLKVISLNGCITSYCDSVIVRRKDSCEIAEVKFVYKRDEQRPNKISFTAISNQPILKQKWTIKRDSSINGSPYVVVLYQNNPTFIFPFAGWYTVCLEATLANGCVKKYCERINIERVVMMAEALNSISVYPNPTRNTARIQLKMETAQAISVTVMDAGGAVKYQLQVGGQTGNNTIHLPVDKLSQGQYLVQLRYGNQVRWARFQKM